MARTPKVVEDRHEQIIDAALRVFAEKGFARATNRDIAREAGITPGLIYYYFKSKEDLLKAALEERSPVHVVAQIGPELLEQPPEVLIPLLITRVLDLIEGEQFVKIIRVILPEMLHGEAEIAPIVMSFFQRVVTFLNDYIKHQQTKGTIRADLDTNSATQVLISSMIGMILRRQIMRDPIVLAYTHEEIVQAVLGLFFRGIQPH